MDLKKKTAAGVSWNVLSQVSTQVVSFGVTIVLARLLSPEDFGIVALSGLFMGFVIIFEDLAMGSAIVQRQGVDDDYLSTSFWASQGTGVALALVLVAVSPFAASFYKEDILRPILMVSAIALVVSPFTTIHKSMLTKNLEFRKLTVITVVRALISGGTSIGLAVSGYGVWSLVLGGVVSGIVSAPLIWLFFPWRPRLFFSKKCFKDLFGFSSNLLLFNIFNYFARNFDNAIIGKFLGAQALGIYAMAYSLMMKPLQHISWSIGRVLFPVFSTIQGDKPRVRTAYLKVVRTIALITFPMMTGLMLVSRDFVLVVLDPKWEGVIVPLQLLCLVGALQSIGTTVGSIFNSQGRSDLQFRTGVVASLGHVAAFLLGIKWGLTGLIKAYIVSNIVFFFFNQYFANRLIELKMGPFLRTFLAPVLCSTVMAGAVLAFQFGDRAVFHLDRPFTLGISVAVGVIAYVAAALVGLGREALLEYKAMLLRR